MRVEALVGVSERSGRLVVRSLAVSLDVKRVRMSVLSSRNQAWFLHQRVSRGMDTYGRLGCDGV